MHTEYYYNLSRCKIIYIEKKKFNGTFLISMCSASLATVKSMNYTYDVDQKTRSVLTLK